MPWEACSDGAITEELTAGKLWPASSAALFLAHWRVGQTDLTTPAVSGLGLEASSFILDLYVNFEKS